MLHQKWNLKRTHRLLFAASLAVAASLTFSIEAYQKDKRESNAIRQFNESVEEQIDKIIIREYQGGIRNPDGLYWERHRLDKRDVFYTVL